MCLSIAFQFIPMSLASCALSFGATSSASSNFERYNKSPLFKASSRSVSGKSEQVKEMSTNKSVLNAYLNFNGNTADAMRFYHSILGGELNMQTFGEANMAQSAAEKNLIVHAALKSDNIALYASDGHPSRKVTFGDNVHLSLMGSEDVRLNLIFNKLAQGGHVDMPLEKQFWGDTFGMVTDKFGVHWMVNITKGSAT